MSTSRYSTVSNLSRSISALFGRRMEMETGEPNSKFERLILRVADRSISNLRWDRTFTDASNAGFKFYIIMSLRLEAGASQKPKQDAQLSQRDRAAGCVIGLVFAKSRRLELGDNILRTV